MERNPFSNPAAPKVRMNDNVRHPCRVAMKDYGARPDEFISNHDGKGFAKAVVDVKREIWGDVGPFRRLDPQQQRQMRAREWTYGQIRHRNFLSGS